MKTTTALGVAALSLVLAFSGYAVGQTSSAGSEQAIDAYIAALRADVRADKITIITQAMQFNDKDGAAFWPVYKKYEADVTTLNDERVRIIKDYADKWLKMTDADAKSLAQRSFDLEGRRVDLRKKYFVEFNKVLPALVVAKFFQLEHRLDLLVDLKLASELPSLLERPAATGADTSQKPN